MLDGSLCTSTLHKFNMIKLYTHKRIASNIFLEMISKRAYNGTKFCCGGYVTRQQRRNSYSKYQILGGYMAVRIEDTEKVRALFGDWQETTIWSCLQKVMGEVYADSAQQPLAAMTSLGDFCYFAGRADAGLVEFQMNRSKAGMIFVPQNEEWEAVIKTVGGIRMKKSQRYALKKEKGVFDEEKLNGIVSSLSPEYELCMIERSLFDKCRQIDWCSDWVANFSDYEMFAKYAIGIVALKDGEPVAGASSYSAYRGGIEVEIVTKDGYRRRGLASVCGAKLILECIKRGLYPSWDAQNPISAHLAQKLGYHPAGAYTVYVLEA